jgi:hypothetical protein
MLAASTRGGMFAVTTKAPRREQGHQAYAGVVIRYASGYGPADSRRRGASGRPNWRPVQGGEVDTQFNDAHDLVTLPAGPSKTRPTNAGRP